MLIYDKTHNNVIYSNILSTNGPVKKFFKVIPKLYINLTSNQQKTDVILQGHDIDVKVGQLYGKTIFDAGCVSLHS